MANTVVLEPSSSSQILDESIFADNLRTIETTEWDEIISNLNEKFRVRLYLFLICYQNVSFF